MKPSDPDPEPSMPSENKPRFVRAAEELAREQGITWQELLRRTRERASSSGYPGPECLLPGDVEGYLLDGGALPAEREAHLASCPACAALMEGARTDPAEAEKIRALVRETSRVPAAPAVAAGQGGRQGGVHPARIAGGAALAGVVVAFLPSGIRRLTAWIKRLRRNPSDPIGTAG